MAVTYVGTFVIIVCIRMPMFEIRICMYYSIILAPLPATYSMGVYVSHVTTHVKYRVYA